MNTVSRGRVFNDCITVNMTNNMTGTTGKRILKHGTCLNIGLNFTSDKNFTVGGMA